MKENRLEKIRRTQGGPFGACPVSGLLIFRRSFLCGERRSGAALCSMPTWTRWLGSEQGGTRPILILQNDVGNYFSPTVVAAAITSRRDKTHLPTHVLLEDVPALPLPPCCCWSRYGRLTVGGWRGYIGQINKKKMEEIDTALAISVSLQFLWHRTGTLLNRLVEAERRNLFEITHACRA